MIHLRKKTAWEDKRLQGRLAVGVWAQVEYDYAPETCSDGVMEELAA